MRAGIMGIGQTQIWPSPVRCVRESTSCKKGHRDSGECAYIWLVWEEKVDKV